MYRFYVNDRDNEQHYAELARIFFPDHDWELIPLHLPPNARIAWREGSLLFNASGDQDRDAIKREMYLRLSRLSGWKPGWGTLTGVKPLKPFAALLATIGWDEEKLLGEMQKSYLLSDEKSQLLLEILRYQKAYVPPVDERSCALYVGIPFCPSKCSYCAFGSELAGSGDIERYLPCLYAEIRTAGALFRASDRYAESVYFGGGTPTVLSAEQLAKLLTRMQEAFGYSLNHTEVSVEAGRPDTMDGERLETLRRLGVSRISVNPQSMNDQTLRTIGRSHTSEDIRNAFARVKALGFPVINSDIIVGLPGEGVSDVTRTLEEVLRLGANNITIHTLSLKRGSRLREEAPAYDRHGGTAAADSLRKAYTILRSADFRPYYIYRQKHQLGALENTGWCLPGTHCLYNIRIMEERQTILGLGSGAIGKRYEPSRDRITHIANIGDWRVYMNRIADILERKQRYFEQG